MDLLKAQLAQLIVSVLIIIGIFVLLALKVIGPSDPIFVYGSSSVLVLILGYWLSVGQQKLQHTQIMDAISSQQTQPPTPVSDPPTAVQTRVPPTVTDWNKYPGTSTK